MKLSKPQEFLTRFGEHCFGPLGEEVGAVQRLGRRLAWYESHLVNMIVDFVENGHASDSLPEEGRWAAVREQRRVDVALCPPSLQLSNPLNDHHDPHSPLNGIPPEVWSGCAITIETKIIPNANWVDIWKSALSDLQGKDGKPGCDYLLACIHAFLPERQMKARWCIDACDALKKKPPGGGFAVRLAEDGGEMPPAGPAIDYVARWPEAPEVIRVPDEPPSWGEVAWLGNVSDIFLILLARS